MKHQYIVGTRLRVTSITSIIMVSGIDEYLPSVRVKGRLGNGRELPSPKKDDTELWVTLLYICSYKTCMGGSLHLKGEHKHPVYIEGR